MKDNLRERLEKHGLSRVAEEIATLAEPAIRFKTSKTLETEIPVGASKLGGKPDLPPDVVWPMWNGTPLSFLLQINLEDLTQYEFASILPLRGVLYFFYDLEQGIGGVNPTDVGSWTVIFSQLKSSDLARRDFPEELETHFSPCTLTFSECLTVPSRDLPVVQSLKLDEKELFAYFDLSHEEGREPLHQLFAYADPIQWGYMQLECQEVTNGISIKERSAYYDLHRKELDRKALDWKLLLQLDSDDDARMMWGDGGRLYFWICIDDLQKRAFDKVWMILQCH